MSCSTSSGRVSVIVPIYNVETYLPKCLDSLVAQTYADIEIIAVDDGSTDGSASILDDYAARYPRIRAVHIANGGVSHARNVGLDLATGEYIGFVDSDDWVDIDMYELMVTAMTDDVDMASAGTIVEGPNGTYTHFSIQAESRLFSREAALLEMFTTESPILLGAGVVDKLYRRRLIDSDNGRVRFSANILSGEDALFTWEAMRWCRQVALVPSYGYHNYEREESMVRNPLTPGYLTLWAAEKQLYDYARAESVELQTLTAARAFRSAVAMGRFMVLAGADSYQRELREIKAFICEHITMLMRSGLSIRMRLGAIYLSLPLPLIQLLRRLIK